MKTTKNPLTRQPRNRINKKVVLTGGFCVGKTSLISKFVYGLFPETYISTLGVNVNRKNVLVGNDEVNMLIWDLAGETSTKLVPPSYYLGASAVIYVFDLSRRASWEKINEDIEFVQKKVKSDIPLFVVGTKKDLIPNNDLAEVIVNIPVNVNEFCSAKTGENVEQLFERIAALMI